MKENDKIIKVCRTIKHFRELKNTTREYIAAELSMTTSGYSKIERGEVDMSLKKLFKISEVLEVEVYQLLDFDVNTIFNYSGSNVQSHGENSKMVVHSNEYLEKYVKLLEKENQRLRASK